MKQRLDPFKAGLALGSLIAFWHLIWGIVVAMGLAQAFLDWIYWLHFLNNPFIVAMFDPTRTLMLVVVTFVFGYFLGWVFATIWNATARK